MTLLFLIIGGILLIGLEILILCAVSYSRARKAGVYSYKTGMYIDLKTNTLVGTKTEVFRDPKTGTVFLGKTFKEN